MHLELCNDRANGLGSGSVGYDGVAGKGILPNGGSLAVESQATARVACSLTSPDVMRGLTSGPVRCNSVPALPILRGVGWCWMVVRDLI